MEKFDWSRIRLARSPWRSQVVPDALPILIRWALEGEPHSYSDLAQELHDTYGHAIKPRKDLYGGVAGGVAQAIEWLSGQWGTPIPPLHLILVNKRTGHAGDGGYTISPAYFVGKSMDAEEDRRAHLRAAMDDVFTYPDWDRVARALGATMLTPATGAVEEVAADAPIPLPKVQEGGKPESDEHKALKAWVASHPEEFVDYGNFPAGTNEKLLSSGDRLDAHFDNGKHRLAVEVKTSRCSEDELQRGVYQAVKYRAIVRAEQKAMRFVPNGEAVLVCTRAPSAETRALIKRLQVRFQQVPLEAEQK
ncbi:hypothetical protein GXB84_06085 [Stenotrophomonas acidaminiphila]|uniref:hypothetical protein n=1 Tax=Stenotrophomonas acidaminiphila TaxID=128780 RepID=UPI0013763AA9|nr:hypothetical protein [Stenotrophomonas acidaminiphila]NCT86898.1 hypothetical protein [Stenotrophomonas acidaminiphila]